MEERASGSTARSDPERPRRSWTAARRTIMKLRRHCQQLGLCLVTPCYFIFSSLVRCVAFQSFSFCLLQLSQQARPHQGACLLLGVLFYFPNLSLFVSSYVKIKKFCSIQFNRLAISWPPWVRVWGGLVGLVTGSYHSLFFLLACPFVSRVISFIYDVRVRGVVSVYNETTHSFFVWGSS